MTEKEIIIKIKEAEEKASFLITAAREEASKLVLDAKLKAKEILHWREADAISKSKKIIEISQEEIKEAGKNHKADLETARSAIMKTAQPNLNAAAEFIKNRFFKKWQQPDLRK